MQQITKNKIDGAPIVYKEIDDYGLDPYEFRIYSRIARRAGSYEGGVCYESIKSIAAGCRMSDRKVKDALNLLFEAGLIKKELRLGTSSIIKLTPCGEWMNPNCLKTLRRVISVVKSGSGARVCGGILPPQNSHGMGTQRLGGEYSAPGESGTEYLGGEYDTPTKDIPSKSSLSKSSPLSLVDGEEKKAEDKENLELKEKLDDTLIEKLNVLDKLTDHQLDSHSEVQSLINDEVIQPEGNVTKTGCIDNYVDTTCFSGVEKVAGGICIETPSTLDTQTNDADISISHNGANALSSAIVDTGERVHDGSLSGGTVRGVVDEVLLGGKQVVSTMNSVNGYIHPTQKTEDRFRRKLHPWRYGFGQDEYKEGFTKYLCDRHLSTCGRHKSNPPIVEDANLWILKRETTDIGIAEITNHWSKYQKELQRIQYLPTSESKLLPQSKKVQTLPEIEMQRRNDEEAERNKRADSVDCSPEEATVRAKAHALSVLLNPRKLGLSNALSTRK